MKTLFTVVCALCLMFNAKADSWDNMTYVEAVAVVAELENNPYIFDYCDCCDAKGEYASKVFFLRVIEATIEPCSWDATYYSVKVRSEVLAELKYTNKGVVTKKLKKASGESNEVLSMNYTWGFDPNTKKAVPFFQKITYSLYPESRNPCKSPFSFPTPKALLKVNGDDIYVNWYAQRVMAGAGTE
jgi:hypothetical protein